MLQQFESIFKLLQNVALQIVLDWLIKRSVSWSGSQSSEIVWLKGVRRDDGIVFTSLITVLLSSFRSLLLFFKWDSTPVR